MSGEWRMEAYYYSFAKTGVDAIDRILSAVAVAGKGCHNTEDWGDYGGGYEHLRGNNYIEMIQNAAIDAADEIERLKAQIPEEMEDRKIIFYECSKGHGGLRGENWIEHPCDICRAEAAETEVQKLRIALDGISEGLNCRGDVETSHYCPNCDNSLFRLRQVARKALEESK